MATTRGKTSEAPTSAAYLAAHHLAELTRLARVHEESEDWPQLCEVLTDLTCIEADPQKRAKHYVRLAIVQDVKLGNPEEAIEALERAVADDPQESEAWEQLIVLLDRQGHVAKLERALHLRFQSSVTPVAKESSRRGSADVVGQLRHTTMVDPGDLEETVPRDIEALSSKDQAVRFLMLRTRVAENPFDAHAYRELFDIAFDRGDVDLAYRIGSVLEDLRESDAKHRAILAAAPPLTLADISGQIDDSAWHTHLEPYQLRSPLTMTMEIINRAFLRVWETSHRESRDSERLLPEGIPGTIARLVTAFRDAAEVLDCVPPQLRMKSKGRSVCSHMPTVFPALSIDVHRLLAVDDELARFLIGVHVATTRPRLRASTFVTSLEDVESAVELGVKIVSGGPIDSEIGRAVKRALERHEIAALGDSLGPYTRGTEALDVHGYLEACAFAQIRAGLLLSGDVSTVRRTLDERLWTPGPLSTWEAVGLSYAFFVSDTFGDLRHAVGATIE
jgi:tetratricopeptide (TPR) repeat protein